MRFTNFFSGTVAIALIAIVASISPAHSASMGCRILQSFKQGSRLGDNVVPDNEIGKLAAPDSSLGVGETFNVDLATGHITGYGLADNTWADDKIVLNPGSLQNSFTLISLSGKGADNHSMYLQIDVFSESRNKPFILVGYGNPVLVGSCTFQ